MKKIKKISIMVMVTGVMMLTSISWKKPVYLFSYQKGDNTCMVYLHTGPCTEDVRY